MCAVSSNPDPARPSVDAPASAAPGRAPPQPDPRPATARAGDGDAPRPRFLRRRRAEAAAAVLPLLALFVLMPPFIGIFVHDGRAFGAPSILVFLLAVWVGLILVSRRLARRLTDRDEAL